MKTSHWIILFIGVVIALFIPYEYNLNATQKQLKENERLESFCISSGQAALAEADFSADEIYRTDDIKNAVVNQFYDVFARNCNYSGTNAVQKAKDHIPCLILTDWDGYYVQYTQWYRASDGGIKYTDLMTEKSKWVNTYGKFMITYRLDNRITVTDTSVSPDAYYTGVYSDVYKKMSKDYSADDLKKIKFLGSEKEFENERNIVVVKAINKSAQYYINTHNDFFNKKDTKYTLNLPSSDDDQFASLLDFPCIISFVQGSQKRTTSGYVNVYTYGAADMIPANIYYVSEDSTGYLSYHKKDCEKLGEVKFIGTMEECAEYGANPCDCVRKQ